MSEDKFQRFKSISEIYKMFGLPKPKHPLIGLVDNTVNSIDFHKLSAPHILEFYKISYKKDLKGKFKYGQNYYDFDEGGMFFASPNQVIGTDKDDGNHSGYTLLIHPDFLLTYQLSRKINTYGFFSYKTNEALHLSDTERKTIITLFKIIEEELNEKIDDFSQDVVISQIELLLNYSNRFYNRQFITRKAINNTLLQRVDEILEDYFTNKHTLDLGIPTVLYLAEQVNSSPSYLSDMLRSLTGQNAQQHIHHKLLEKAKTNLSSTELSISEIAYELGFEHPQSFSKFFKIKAGLSPVEFRKSFN